MRETVLFAMVLGVLVVACSGTPPPSERRLDQRPQDAHNNPVMADGEATTCTADADCVTSNYFDPDIAGGCCPAIAGASCVASVVTAAEAEHRRGAWEARCSSVRCAPSASCAVGIWTPVPACRDGVCVDTARADGAHR